METPTYIKNVAIIGASGNLGSVILKSLLSTNKFTITIITRESFPSVFPTDASITIKKGNYDSHDFLHSALSGQDALLLVLGGAALIQPQIKLIEAAASAGVKWILPTEYGTDSANEELTNAVPLNSIKVAPRLRLEELRKTHQGLHWIGVITGLWFDYALTAGFFKINIPARHAVLLSGGTAKFNTTTKHTIAEAVAGLLCLPETSSTAPSLSRFVNGFAYISDFLTSQREILSSVQRVTVTTDADWKIEYMDADVYVAEGRDRMVKGDLGGMVGVLGGLVFGGKGDYESLRGLSNAVLGLPEEKEGGMDEAVREALGLVRTKT